MQKIRIGGAVSKDTKVILGITRGSHLEPLCFIWLVRFSEILDYVGVLVYVRNSLLLNVGKCKTITFGRSRHPVDVEFSYMLGGTMLDRVSSINDLGFIMDEKMTF
jgi:hypothetical protein